jgi:hypothetical protein
MISFIAAGTLPAGLLRTASQYTRAVPDIHAAPTPLHEVAATRDADAETQATVAELQATVIELQEEILRLRDLVVGKDAERAAALGRAAELESWALRYDAVIGHQEEILRSTSWRTSQFLLTPLRWFRRTGSR